MTDTVSEDEAPKPSSRERMYKLMEEVTSKRPEDVGFLTRALVAVELAKDAIDEGKVSPHQGLEFAQSLKDFSTVPVVIGTPECKLFPIDLIMQARPAIIENYRKAAALESMDFNGINDDLKSKAQRISDILEIGVEWVAKTYGPFALSPKDAQEAIAKKVESSVAAKEMLTGTQPQTPEQTDSANLFMRLNFANFIAGQSLEDYIKKNYQFR